MGSNVVAIQKFKGSRLEKLSSSSFVLPYDRSTPYMNKVRYSRSSLRWMQFLAEPAVCWKIEASAKPYLSAGVALIRRFRAEFEVFPRSLSAPPLLYLGSSGSRSVPGTRSFRGIISPHLTARRSAAIYGSVASSFTGKTAWKVTVRFLGTRGRGAYVTSNFISPVGEIVSRCWSHPGIRLSDDPPIDRSARFVFICLFMGTALGCAWIFERTGRGGGERKWNCHFNPFLFSSFVCRQSTHK